jgi:hypothetical protein
VVSQLIGADVVRDLIRALVNLPADDLVRARRACVVGLRRPHHPLAVDTVEQGDDQFPSFQVPQAHGLVGTAGEKVTAVGRRRHGNDVALVADEVAETLTRQVVGGEPTVEAAGDDDLSFGREGVGSVPVAIG